MSHSIKERGIKAFLRRELAVQKKDPSHSSDELIHSIRRTKAKFKSGVERAAKRGGEPLFVKDRPSKKRGEDAEGTLKAMGSPVAKSLGYGVRSDPAPWPVKGKYKHTLQRSPRLEQFPKSKDVGKQRDDKWGGGGSPQKPKKTSPPKQPKFPRTRRKDEEVSLSETKKVSRRTFLRGMAWVGGGGPKAALELIKKHRKKLLAGSARPNRKEAASVKEGIKRDLRVMRRKALDLPAKERERVSGSESEGQKFIKDVAATGKSGIERAKKSGGFYKKFGFPGIPTPRQHAAAKYAASKGIGPSHGTDVAVQDFGDDVARRVLARARIKREQSPESKARTKAGRRGRVQTKRELRKRYPGDRTADLNHTTYTGRNVEERSEEEEKRKEEDRRLRRERAYKYLTTVRGGVLK